jgi:hypothetical protein
MNNAGWRDRLAAFRDTPYVRKPPAKKLPTVQKYLEFIVDAFDTVDGWVGVVGTIPAPGTYSNKAEALAAAHDYYWTMCRDEPFDLRR